MMNALRLIQIFTIIRFGMVWNNFCSRFKPQNFNLNQDSNFDQDFIFVALNKTMQWKERFLFFYGKAFVILRTEWSLDVRAFTTFAAALKSDHFIPTSG